MNLENRPRVVAYAVTALYGLIFALLGVTTPDALTKILSFLPVIVVICFAVYDQKLWHQKFLLRFAERPFIAGTWVGTLQSYRRDESDKRIQSSHDIAIVIRQDFLTVSVTLMSKESKSRSSAAQIIRHQKNDYSLQYQYANKPVMSVQHRSSMHTGGCTIDITGMKVANLTGEYWTARDSRGTFEVQLISREIAGSFEEAERLRK